MELAASSAMDLFNLSLVSLSYLQAASFYDNDNIIYG